MIKYLTHEEACALVEGAIERCAKTLAYIRLRLDGQKGDVFPDRREVRETDRANLLCNINYYGAYLKGAIAMLLRLRESQLTLEEHIDAASKQYGSTKLKVTAEGKIHNKALLDLILKNTLNIERFLEGGHRVAYTDHERDKKGKLIKCRACFVKKVVKYKEIE